MVVTRVRAETTMPTNMAWARFGAGEPWVVRALVRRYQNVHEAGLSEQSVTKLEVL